MRTEKVIIGSMLLSEKAVDLCINALKEEDFSVLKHRAIYSAIGKLYDKKAPIEPVSVYETVHNWKYPDALFDYLQSCIDVTIVADAPEYYITKLKEESEDRKAKEVCSQFITGKATRDELVGRLEETEYIPRRDIVRVGEDIENSLDYIEELKSGSTDLLGIKTGLIDLDSTIGGMKKGNYIIIGARPSNGKTLLGLNIARRVVKTYQKPILLFSFESTVEEFKMRLMYAEAKVSENRVKDGYTSDKDWANLTLAAGMMKSWPIYISDNVDINALQVRARARQFVRRNPETCLIIIDYLQEVCAIDRKMTDFESVTETSRQIAKMAKELRVPVIAMSQLSRKSEEGKGRKPRLSDLRQTGQLEQDADVVMMLDYPYRRTKENRNHIECGIVKGRDIQCRDINLHIIPEEKRIESARSFE